jgi:uncharacterized protein YbjT (DUF2867 family)
MTNNGKAILVAGATGNQGGATAHHLLKDGWTVRALTRDPASEPALALARAGAEVIAGDLGDRASVDAAVKGVHGVFSVQRTQFPGAPDGFTVEDEICQGILLAEAAKAAGVAHFIYASVGGAERDSQIPFWESKWAIEKHIHSLRLPATIIRPVSFMENFAAPYFRLPDGAITFFVEPDKVTQFVAVDDIGAFAALAFRHPENYIGQAFEFAGDALSYAQAAAAIGRALERDIRYVQYPPEVTGQIPELAAAARFNERDGYHAHIPDLRRRLPGLKTFDAWLAEGGAERIRAHGQG